jgi:hypothetical protein
MEVEGTVRIHSANDTKEKYIATIIGISANATAYPIEVTVKLEGMDDELLKRYPRGERFQITIGPPKQKKTKLKEPQ